MRNKVSCKKNLITGKIAEHKDVSDFVKGQNCDGKMTETELLQTAALVVVYSVLNMVKKIKTDELVKGS